MCLIFLEKEKVYASCKKGSGQSHGGEVVLGEDEKLFICFSVKISRGSL